MPRGYRAPITSLARRHSLGLRWLDERTLQRLGANAFLAVAAANRSARRRHRAPDLPAGGAASSSAPDVALVGKGILFDTGGVNLKPHRSMLDMHTDMSGSAVALATLIALAELQAPIAVDAWLAITENRIGPHAYRPQEVIRAANGVTIQVIHTDAEGRMVLADTLALAGRTAPAIHDRFRHPHRGVRVRADRTHERRVHQPPGPGAQAVSKPAAPAASVSGTFRSTEDYDTDLESKVADILQCAVDGKGDHILATRFL